MNCRIAKLGGSFYSYRGLTNWLMKLQHQSRHHPIIIVPGGGPFADQVRQAQQQHNCSDQSAHHMALLAMAQFGLLLADKLEQASLFHYPTDNITDSLSVWIPDQALLDYPELMQNWSLTSDSLAFWLAQQLNAEELHLLKRIRTLTPCLQQLAKDGVVDIAFPQIYAQSTLPVRLFRADDLDLYPDKGLLLK